MIVVSIRRPTMEIPHLLAYFRMLSGSSNRSEAKGVESSSSLTTSSSEGGAPNRDGLIEDTPSAHQDSHADKDTLEQNSLHTVFIDDKGLPTIHVDVEADDNLDIDIEPEKMSFNHLHPGSAAPDSRSISSRSSKLSSAMSFVSVASSQVSGRLDLDGSKALCNRSFGLLLAFISGVLMTAYSSMIKMLDDMDSMQVVVIRGVLQLVIMGSIACFKNLSFAGARERHVPIVLFLVSLTGGLRLLFIFTSFSRLPLGDSTTIVFSSPVFVMMFSICILKENILNCATNYAFFFSLKKH